jgi:hypothetical protein
MSFDADRTSTSSTEASWSFLTLNAGNDAIFTDVHGAFNEYDSATDATSGWSTLSDGTTVLSYHEYLSTFFSETVSDTYGPTVGGTDTFGELTIQSTCGSTTDITGNNWSGFTTITHSSNYSSESSLTGGWEWSDTDEFEIVGGIPESATSGSLLVEFQDEQDGAGKLLADYSSGSIFLYDSYGGYWLDAGYCYVPHTVPAYLSGLAPDVGLAPSGWPVTAPSSNAAFGFVPSTDAATAHGLPTEKATALDNMALNDGPTDGVSQTATAPPTSVLITLAAAGRNPTDILIPTQAGTEGSGGDDDEDDDVAGGGSASGGMSFNAMADGADGKSHEVSAQQSPLAEGAKAFGASLWNSTGGALYNVFTFKTGAALGERAFKKAEARNIQDPGVATFVGMVGKDLIGAGAVEAWHDIDLATFEPIGGELLDGGDRTHRFVNGSLAFLGTASLVGLGVARVPLIRAKMYPKPTAPPATPAPAPASEPPPVPLEPVEAPPLPAEPPIAEPVPAAEPPAGGGIGPPQTGPTGPRTIEPATLPKPPGMSNTKLGDLLRWPKGPGTQASQMAQAQQLIEELAPARIAEVQASGFTREMALRWAEFYEAEAIRVPQNVNAAARVSYLRALAEHL